MDVEKIIEDQKIIAEKIQLLGDSTMIIQAAKMYDYTKTIVKCVIMIKAESVKLSNYMASGQMHINGGKGGLNKCEFGTVTIYSGVSRNTYQCYLKMDNGLVILGRKNTK